MDEIDRILSGEEPLAPSPGFVTAVMTTVRRESAPPPIPFPWRRLAVGGIAMAIWIAAAPLLAPKEPVREALRALLEVLGSPLMVSLLASTTAGLLGSLLLVRVAMRFVLARN